MEHLNAEHDNIVLMKHHDAEHAEIAARRYKNHIEFRPGDAMQINCVYNSMSKADVTTYGDATSDEMCFAFFVYYPSTHLLDQCFASRTALFCPTHVSDFEEYLGNCSLQPFFKDRMPSVTKRLTENCEASTCRVECLEVLQWARTDPCLEEEIAIVTEPIISEYGTEEMVRALPLLHSCDREIYAPEDLNDTTSSNEDQDKYAEADGMVCAFTGDGTTTRQPDQSGDAEREVSPTEHTEKPEDAGEDSTTEQPEQPGNGRGPSPTENPGQPGDGGGGASALGLSFALVAAALVLSTSVKVTNL